jgi:hypothetical protein
MVILCSTCVNRVYIRLLACCARRYGLASVAQGIHREIQARRPLSTAVFWLYASQTVIARRPPDELLSKRILRLILGL